MLEDYFGEETHRELSKLAQEASTRSVRGGPRVLIIPGIMGSKIGKKGRIFDDTIWIDPFDIATGNLADLRLNGEDTRLRALGDNLSVAKWLEHRNRKYGPRLDVLLVVNPTGDLLGAAVA
jgi:hypothetical protein